MLPRAPLITCIVPLYNSAPTIADALDSLQHQSIPDLQILVINDGSTDQGPEIAAAFAANDPRISIIHQPNQGLASARNTGLAYAMGSFVHVLDADDWMLPLGLEALLRAAQQTGASYAGYQLRDHLGRPFGREHTTSAAELGFAELLAWNRTGCHCYLTHRSLIAGHRFDTSLPVCEDYDFWLTLARSGVRFRAADRLAGAYRVSPSSMSRDHRKIARTHAAVVRAHLDRHAPPDTTPEQLAQIARDSVHAAARTQAALAALAGDRDTARVILDELDHPRPIEPDQLATSAVVAITHGLALAPDPDTADRWLPPLLAWLYTLPQTGDLACDPLRVLDAVADRGLHPRDTAGLAAARPDVRDPHAHLVAHRARVFRQLARAHAHAPLPHRPAGTHT